MICGVIFQLVPSPTLTTMMTFISSRTVLVGPILKVRTTTSFATHISCCIQVRFVLCTHPSLNDTNEKPNYNDANYNPHFFIHPFLCVCITNNNITWFRLKVNNLIQVSVEYGKFYNKEWYYVSTHPGLAWRSRLKPNTGSIHIGDVTNMIFKVWNGRKWYTNCNTNQASSILQHQHRLSSRRNKSKKAI